MICSCRLGQPPRFVFSFIFSLGYPIAQRSKWGFLFCRRTKRHTHTPTSQHASYTALANVSAALFEGKESVWDSETSAPCPRIFLLPVRSKTELGNQPQQAQTPQSWLDIDLHASLSLFVFALITCNRSRTFSRLRKTASAALLLFMMLFDVGGLISFRKYGHKTCHQGRRHPSFSQ